jgi:hypothetical protein
MQMPVLDPRIGMFLLERYPGIKREGLRSMWACAWAWVEDHLPDMAAAHPAFEVAALFRLQAMCAQDAKIKAGFMFSAREALAPHLRR